MKTEIQFTLVENENWLLANLYVLTSINKRLIKYDKAVGKVNVIRRVLYSHKVTHDEHINGLERSFSFIKSEISVAFTKHEWISFQNTKGLKSPTSVGFAFKSKYCIHAYSSPRVVMPHPFPRSQTTSI